MIRIAAIGDVHVGIDDAGMLAPTLGQVHEDADVLLLAGDLTRHGDPAEARILAHELSALQVPVVAVLGNHDYHLDAHEQVTRELVAAGVHVLDGEVATISCSNGAMVSIVGAKGFGGGFAGACGTEFGEQPMKEFIRYTRSAAQCIEHALASAERDATRRIALLHYAPCRGTCVGEKREIFPFLGSYLLGDAIDRAGADLVIHGHAHHGSERATTVRGIPVRNVARPLVGVAYCRFELAAPVHPAVSSTKTQASAVHER